MTLYGTPAITVGAGNQYGEIYNFSALHDVVVVGGEEQSVGFAGHMLGGGGGPLSPLYGLAVDIVLEVEVVTPGGDLIVANECQHPELFWAMRGGGGSTFGVLVSATVKAHPDVRVAKFDLSFSSTEKEAKENGNAGFYALLANLYAQRIIWSDSYIGGYINFGPSWQLAFLDDGSVPEPPSSGDPYPYTMVFTGYGLNHSAAQLNATMPPSPPSSTPQPVSKERYRSRKSGVPLTSSSVRRKQPRDSTLISLAGSGTGTPCRIERA